MTGDIDDEENPLDLSLPVSIADMPSVPEMRLTVLSLAAGRAVAFQRHDNPHRAVRMTVQPSGRWQALRRPKALRMWRIEGSPINGLYLGEDRQLYALADDTLALTVTVFVASKCEQQDILRLIDAIFDMGGPPAWKI